MEIKCTNCKLIKKSDEFNSQKRKVNGKSSQCKTCVNKGVKIFFKTKIGLITKIYRDQKASSRRRGHNLPAYTKQELKDWMFSQEKFHLLYDNWKISNYQKKLIPSVDRKNDYIGYKISNIQLTTWEENNKKGLLDRKNGINNKTNKKVLQYSTHGHLIEAFHSTREAERCTGISHGNISSACKGRLKTAGGFKWKYFTK